MKKQIQLPMISVRDCVLFPNVSASLFVGRQHSIETLKEAIQNHRGQILVFTQKDPLQHNPMAKKDLYTMGTICVIESHLELADETMKIRIRAIQRVKLNKVFTDSKNSLKSLVRFGIALPLPKATTHSTSSLPSDERRSTLGLLLRWNPEIALNEENNHFECMKKERNLGRFIDQILEVTFCPSIRRTESIQEMSKRRVGVGSLETASKEHRSRFSLQVKARMALLKESSKQKQIKMLKKILVTEILQDLK